MSKSFEAHTIIEAKNQSRHQIFSTCPNQVRTFKHIKVTINLAFEAN